VRRGSPLSFSFRPGKAESQSGDARRTPNPPLRESLEYTAERRPGEQKDLLHEPWHLLLPLGASPIASAVLFVVAFGRWFHHDPAFLGLFWMTAPLAWLYALPYERFLSPAHAMQANLLTLGVVAAWRVALMVRVLVVLLDYRALTAFFLVMVFGDAVALVATLMSPVPLLATMGGIGHLSESDRGLLVATGGVA
jgi:hypothetical protein